jgi:hypothetical protein
MRFIRRRRVIQKRKEIRRRTRLIQRGPESSTGRPMSSRGGESSSDESYPEKDYSREDLSHPE